MTRAFAALQRILPQHGLSRFLGSFAASRQKHIKRLLIEGFKTAYQIDMAEFEGESGDDFASFNDFFGRRLRPGLRPLPEDAEAIVSPVDGTVSQAGAITDGRLVQAKGHDYSAAALLDDVGFAAALAGGSFVTLYLAPHNYHRVHAPCSARLLVSRQVPGALYSVNAATEQHVPGLFARNERLALRLGAAFGDFALVLVGAMIVASIEAAWPGGPTTPYRRRVARTPEDVYFQRGDEVGAFLLGSTVVALFPPGVELAAHVRPGTEVRMGSAIAALPKD